MYRDLTLKVSSGALILILSLALQARPANAMLSGQGVFRFVSARVAVVEASTGEKYTVEAADCDDGTYRYSNRYSRPKPAIKRMGQINVRNRNGGIR